MTTNDLLSALLDGDVPVLCQYLTGQLLPVAPMPGAILSGAFNPLHHCHLPLGQAASSRLGVEVHFELTLRNADKPPLTIEEVEPRMRQFIGVKPLLLTTAPTFAERAKLFPGTTWVVGIDTAE